MSVFCPKCGKQTYNEYTCDFCREKIKEEKIIKENWQPPKPKFRKISNKEKTTNMNNNTLLTAAIFIIAISLGYLAYSKYQEREMTSKFMKNYLGSDDPDEIIQIQKNMIKDLNKEINKANKQFIKQNNNFQKQIQEQQKNLFKNLN